MVSIDPTARQTRRNGQGGGLMWQYIKSKLNIWKSTGGQEGLGDDPGQATHLKKSLIDNMVVFQGKFDSCADLVVREFTACGRKMTILMMDNMIDKLNMTKSVLTPLTTAVLPAGMTEDDALLDWIRDDVLAAVDQREIFTFEESVWLAMSGFALLLVDGFDRAVVFGLQDFKFRSIDEPNVDKVSRGSREGFVEPLRINLMMMRRRLKNPALKFEVYQLGKESKTEVCLSYLKGVASESVLESIRHRLKTINIDTVLASGYIQPYFQDHPYSIFSTVGYTERPDTLCGKMEEGRVGILVDGTPMALITPYLLIENFQNIDDYAVGSYYATFTRILKYLAFFISVMLPGIYVAIGSFHQSLLPSQLLYILAQSEEGTPFDLMGEALIMQVIYEILREAGLRTPKQMGSSLNIVGAFLIGQAAVSAGLIGAPMVIIVALTATTSLVVPTLYEPGVILRFSYILAAGISGFYGLTLVTVVTLAHICSMKIYDIPYTAPIAPLGLYSMRDVVIRAPWKDLSQRKVRVQDMPGSDASRNPG